MAAIKQVAQPNHTAKDLLRRSPVAPFTLDIKAIGATGQSKVESVDFWFAAYGSWQVANSGEFLQSVLKVMEQENPENKLPKSLLLTPQQLSARKIQVPADTPELEQKWYHTTFALFDRVQVSSTRWTAIRRLANSTTLAVKIDPRLAGDPEYPDQWRSITRTDSDQIQFGPPQPYVSAGFYLKATRLIEPAGAMFIECHMIFDEPRGWFGGANLLRSKLPLAVQEEVRNFRRRLSAASQGK
jgi:hypothetical protein